MLLTGWFEAEVFICKSGGDAAALGAIEQAKLHQVGLVDFLDGVLFFAERSRNRVESDRSAGIFLQDGEHEVAVHFVEAMLIDAEHLQRLVCNRERDVALRPYLSEIARAAQEPVGDARRAAAAARNLERAIVVDGNPQD